ncbi:hypothetical protein GSQ38_18960, partial [Clostridioides difficile]|nr:hypothetical protein [Clostridioides difficile]
GIVAEQDGNLDDVDHRRITKKIGRLLVVDSEKGKDGINSAADILKKEKYIENPYKNLNCNE